jgi:hypothetical protein
VKTLVLLGQLLALLSAFASAQVSANTIDVKIIACAEDAGVTPTLKLNRWPDRVGASPLPELRPKVSRWQSGMYGARFVVDPGNYLISATSAHCKSLAPTTVPVFASWRRHVAIVTSESCCSVPTLYGSAVAALVPSGIYADFMPLSDTARAVPYIGTLDDGVFYFSNLPPGKYALEVGVIAVVACMEVDIPRQVAAFQKSIVVDWGETASLLRAAAERPTRHTCRRS